MVISRWISVWCKKSRARATAALSKLNGFLLGSIQELVRQEEKVAGATFCTKRKSTFRIKSSFALAYFVDDAET